MPINCPRCGAQNADHSKFCLSCGNDLRAAAPSAPGGFGPPPAPPPAPGGFGPPPAPGGFGPPPGGGGFGPPPPAPGGFGPPPAPGGGGFGPPPAPGGGGFGPPPAPPAPGGFGPPPAPGGGGFGPPPAPPPAPGGFGPPPAPGGGGFGPPPAPGGGGFGPPPAPPPAPGGFGPPPAAGGGFGPPPAPPPAPGGFGPPPAAPGGFAPPPAAPPPAAPSSPGFAAPPQSSFQPPVASGGSGGDLANYCDGLRMIAAELRGIAGSKTIFSTQVLPAPLPGVAAVAVRYGRSMHVLCAGGPFAQPIWPSRDFADRDRLLQATIGTNVPPEVMIPWVLTYVLPGVYPDLGKDAAGQKAFLEASDAFGVGIDQAGLEAARRQGFPELKHNHVRFLVVSEPKQSIAGIELRWGDRPFEMLYVPTPGVVARSAPWT